MCCKICKGKEQKIIYDGPIRLGGISNISKRNYVIYRCENCKIVYLDNQIQNLEKFYSSEEYRNQIGQNNDIETYKSIHDGDLSHYFRIMPHSEYRNKNVLDFGCGAGSFLDSISGIASGTIGIEKNVDYLEHLKNNNHKIDDDLINFSRENSNSLDIAVSHSVLEHLEDPCLMISKLYDVIKLGGKLFLTTPNHDNFLISQNIPEYNSFFYRIVHLYYFNNNSLRFMLEKVGFKDIKIGTINTYNFSNTLLWLKDKKGCGNDANIIKNHFLELAWQSFIENSLQGDRIFCIATK